MGGYNTGPWNEQAPDPNDPNQQQPNGYVQLLARLRQLQTGGLPQQQQPNGQPMNQQRQPYNAGSSIGPSLGTLAGIGYQMFKPKVSSGGIDPTSTPMGPIPNLSDVSPVAPPSFPGSGNSNGFFGSDITAYGNGGIIAGAGLGLSNMLLGPGETTSPQGVIGGGGIGGLLTQLANGGFVQGPTQGLIGEAGPEMLSHDDGTPPELITQPQVRTLGMHGTDTVTPLTPPPHRITPAGKNLIKRLHPKHRFADGGSVDGGEDDALYGSDLDAMEAESQTNPQLNAPDNEPSAPSGPIPAPAGSANLGAPPQLAPQYQSPSPVAAEADSVPPAASLGKAPPSVRDQIAALRTPVPTPPSMGQRVAAGVLGGLAGWANQKAWRGRPIDTTAATQNILYPGQAQKQQQFNAQAQDLQRQLAMQQGGQQDQLQAAQLAHTKAQTGLVNSQIENPAAAHPDWIPDPDPNKLDPKNYPGLHLGPVGPNGQPMYRQTPAEAERDKQVAKVSAEQSTADTLPPAVAKELGVDPSRKFAPAIAEKYYAVYAKALESKNPTVASLAMKAAKGDQQAAQALKLISQTNVQSKVTVNSGSDNLASKRAIREAFNQAGGDWNKVLAGARNMQYGDYSSDIADHAAKMTQLPTAQQTKVAAADTTVEQVQTAIDAVKAFTKAHPDVVGSGWTNPVTGIKRFIETQAGTEPDDIGNVDMALSSVAALQPQQHGFRSASALEGFKRDAGIDLRTHQYDPNRAWLINPSKTVSGLQAIADFNAKLKDSILKTAGKGGSAPTGSSGAGQVVVTAPDGSKHPFDTQAQADAFKRLANIR